MPEQINNENENLLGNLFEEIEVCNSCGIEVEQPTHISNYSYGGDEILEYCPHCHGIEQGTKFIKVPLDELM